MRRRILIVLVALALAGLSAMAVLVYARGADRRAVADRQGVYVLLAHDRIPRGTSAGQIRAGKLAERVLMPSETVPDGALDVMSAGLDPLRLSADLAPDQMLMRGMFTTDEQTAAQAGVPDDKLAVSIEVTMAPGVAEKVTSGDAVTVFVTYPKDFPPSSQKTRVLLPKATVISIATGPPSDVTPSPSASRSTKRDTTSYPATLAVDQDEATRLVHAAQTGLIYLGLVGVEATIEPSPAVDYTNIWR
jgi:pilus assembly protein CpaB